MDSRTTIPQAPGTGSDEALGTNPEGAEDRIPPYMTIRTIEELGRNLPIGVEASPGGPRVRDFAFRRWTAAEELDLGKARDDNRAATPAEFATEVLARLLTRWGPHNFETMPEVERKLALKSSFAADVYAAWFALRREAVENEYTLTITCPCRHSFPYAVDLGSVEVGVLDDDDPLAYPFALRDGFEFRGDLRKVLTLSQIRWTTYEGFGAATGLNVGMLKIGASLGAIVGVGGVSGGPIRLPPNALDGLSKFDLESLANEVGDVQAGPILSIECACPKCRTTIAKSIDWTYDAFFSRTSSRSGRGRRFARTCSSSPTRSPGSPST